jgi:xanthine dehydrogenase accessory factor
MLVWETGQSGTIGGGALEHHATIAARAQTKTTALSRIPLGPSLGQCCGGAVTLVTEVYDAANLPPGPIAARSIDGSPMPLAVKRLLATARNQGTLPQTQLVQNWLIEPVSLPTRHLWLWGAGHVGRAIASVMAPLPDLHITWIDTTPGRFPDVIPEGVHILPARDPTAAVALAPQNAEHLILTFSHNLDLELCHSLLNHGFSRCGLIGSATKWARFRSRLAALGHTPQRIAQITCPIGDPALGKHPQAIALGVATMFLRRSQPADLRQSL